MSPASSPRTAFSASLVLLSLANGDMGHGFPFTAPCTQCRPCRLSESALRRCFVDTPAEEVEQR